ncbi:MAG: hypothetical protein H6838_14110 [Planctomycetes bacterium]|nr:hypothetical protein [Planctomycetota bacterium]MCB9886624.1 hypothetical protein [Planctomycetota bacterium]
MIWFTLVWILAASFVAVRLGRFLDSGAEPERPRDEAVPVPVETSLLAGHCGERRRRAALDLALETLDRHDPTVAKTALLSWIGGLSAVEIAAVLNVEAARVERDLQMARDVLRAGPQ